MPIYYKKPEGGGVLLHGDCLEEMKRLPDELCRIYHELST